MNIKLQESISSLLDTARKGLGIHTKEEIRNAILLMVQRHEPMSRQDIIDFIWQEYPRMMIMRIDRNIEYLLSEERIVRSIHEGVYIKYSLPFVAALLPDLESD